MRPSLVRSVTLASIAATLIGPVAPAGEKDRAPDRIAIEASDVTTVLLVRHAERLDDSADAPLSDAGTSRAAELARILEPAGIGRIHSSDFSRTRDTAAPLAERLGIEVEIYDPRELAALALELRKAPGTHLVVGHSNTTPELVSMLGGDPVSAIDHHEYDRIYAVGIGADGRVRSTLSRFGKRFRPAQSGLLAEMLTGSFSSAAQAARDPEHFRDIRLFMVPIWTARDDGPWLYVEQSSASALDRPYRQRVYHLVDGPEGPRSDVFELPGDPLAYAGAWRAPRRFDAFGPEALVARSGCSIHLRETQDDGATVFAGSTQGDACKSTLRGASYATSQVTVTDVAMTSWDRGFDAEGRQVWGAERGPYVFLRQVEPASE